MAINSKKLQIGLFLKLIWQFDLASALFRSFELTAVKEVSQGLKIDEPILDIGCAEGRIAKELLKNKEVIGLDYEMDYLSSARKLKFYKYLVRADAGKMPFKDNAFQFLFSNSVIEHIKELDDVLEEARRILKNEGLFLFTVPNENFAENLFFYRALRLMRLNKLAFNYAKERNKRLNHFHMYNEETWSQILQRSGLRAMLFKEYISKNTLILWDVIAAIQFVFKKMLAVPLKTILIRNILTLLLYPVKMICAILLLPIFVFLSVDVKDGCATLVVVGT